MKALLDAPIVNLAGTQIKDGDVPLTLKVICVRALVSGLDEDKNMAPEKVIERYSLAQTLQAGGEVELTPEQLAELRKRIAKIFFLEVAGASLAMLNG